jgi:hypothetical protein
MCLVLQLAAATSLQQALLHTGDGRTIALWLAQLAIGVVLLAAVQLRHLAHLSWLCYGGNLAQLLATCLMSAGLLLEAKNRSTEPHCAAVPQEACQEEGWLYRVVTLLGAVFAFGGQYAYVDVANQMACRQAFATVQHVSTCIMTLLYLVFGSLVYAVRGQAARGLEVFAMHGSPGLSSAVVVCVLLQTLVQQVVSINILTTTCVSWWLTCKRRLIGKESPASDACASVAGAAGDQGGCSRAGQPASLAGTSPDVESSVLGEAVSVSTAASTARRSTNSGHSCPNEPVLDSSSDAVDRASLLAWFVCSFVTIAASAVISTFVPSIKHLAGILAAGADLMLAYGLPCLFAVALLGDTVRSPRRWKCAVVLLRLAFVATVAASIGGVMVSVLSFVQSRVRSVDACSSNTR